MNWFFLQIDTTAAAAQAANTVAQPAQQISIIDLLSKGGVLMIPLALLFVVAVFVLLEVHLSKMSPGQCEVGINFYSPLKAVACL